MTNEREAGYFNISVEDFLGTSIAVRFRTGRSKIKLLFYKFLQYSIQVQSNIELVDGLITVSAAAHNISIVRIRTVG